MPTNPLQDLRDSYDVVVIGDGLDGMTTANILARVGHSVLLAEAVRTASLDGRRR